MKEIKGNIFEVEADAICVTTNGIVKANGELVMGAGIAKQFAIKHPQLPRYFGNAVKGYGNHSFAYHKDSKTPYTILTLPTKEDWKNPSTIELIVRSIKEVIHWTNTQRWSKVVLPRPGCANGGLDWETQVKPAIEPLLDDRFYIITPGN